MSLHDLKIEVLKEVSRKAYELQIKANLAQNDKMDIVDLLAAERAIHHEIKRLRKLIKRLEKAKSEADKLELEQRIYYELNWQ